MDLLFEIVSASGKILLLLNVISIILVNIKHSVFHPKHLSKSMILLMVLLMGILYIEIFSTYLSGRGTPNLYLTHYYIIGQFFILSIVSQILMVRSN